MVQLLNHWWWILCYLRRYFTLSPANLHVGPESMKATIKITCACSKLFSQGLYTVITRFLGIKIVRTKHEVPESSREEAE